MTVSSARSAETSRSSRLTRFLLEARVEQHVETERLADRPVDVLDVGRARERQRDRLARGRVEHRRLDLHVRGRRLERFELGLAVLPARGLRATRAPSAARPPRTGGSGRAGPRAQIRAPRVAPRRPRGSACRAGSAARPRGSGRAAAPYAGADCRGRWPAPRGSGRPRSPSCRPAWPRRPAECNGSRAARQHGQRQRQAREFSPRPHRRPHLARGTWRFTSSG